jgi:hypothetical protein
MNKIILTSVNLILFTILGFGQKQCDSVNKCSDNHEMQSRGSGGIS